MGKNYSGHNYTMKKGPPTPGQGDHRANYWHNRIVMYTVKKWRAEKENHKAIKG